MGVFRKMNDGTLMCVRRKKSPTFKRPVRNRKGDVKLRPLDNIEKTGYIRGIVKEIIHDPGRGAPLAKGECI